MLRLNRKSNLRPGTSSSNPPESDNGNKSSLRGSPDTKVRPLVMRRQNDGDLSLKRVKQQIRILTVMMAINVVLVFVLVVKTFALH